MNRNTSLLFGSILIILSCEFSLYKIETTEINSNYFGTYLYEDDDCSGYDIQYATLDNEGITFFDYLGDNCDDTVGCYATYAYELSEITQDSFLLLPEIGNPIVDGIINIDSDTLMTLTYTTDNSTNEYIWGKFSDNVHSFSPSCDQKYGYTKDLSDMMIYAVSNDGSLLWKQYLHGGIWDLATSVAPLSDGGYMVYGIFDAIEWGGCCYTKDYDHRDIIKFDSGGNIEWTKELEISSDGFYDDGGHLIIGNSLFETSFGDLVFLTTSAPGNNPLRIVMMNYDGEIIWTKSYAEDGLSCGGEGGLEILESKDGDLVLAGGTYAYGYGSGLVVILDYMSGEILEKTNLPSGFSKRIIEIDDGFILAGVDRSYYDDNAMLMKVNDIGELIWSQTYNDPALLNPLDLIQIEDGGFLILGNSPYATLVKTDDEGNEEWRKIFNDFRCGFGGWIHQTDDGGFLIVSEMDIAKLDSDYNVVWNAISPKGFQKFFNNGMVSGINHDMKKIDGGAIMVGYGSSDWE